MVPELTKSAAHLNVKSLRVRSRLGWGLRVNSWLAGTERIERGTGSEV